MELLEESEMKFPSAILILFIINSLPGCSENIEFHNIQSLVENNKIKMGDKPFKGMNIQKLCILVSGANIGEYLDSTKNVPYGHMAIIEYRINSNKIGYVKEGTITHQFPLNTGTGYCTEDVENLFVNKINKNWVLAMENN